MGREAHSTSHTNVYSHVLISDEDFIFAEDSLFFVYPQFCRLRNAGNYHSDRLLSNPAYTTSALKSHHRSAQNQRALQQIERQSLTDIALPLYRKDMEGNHLMPTSTPWGPSQTSHEIAPGICFYSTASHGGYHLSLDRFDTFRQFFPDFTLWAGDRWFEEDCDSALVTITFAQDFSDQAVFFAEQSIRACVQNDKTSNGKWHQVWANITNNKTF